MEFIIKGDIMQIIFGTHIMILILRITRRRRAEEEEEDL